MAYTVIALADNFLLLSLDLKSTCRGSVGKTPDPQPWGPSVHIFSHGSCAFGQGTLSSLPSLLEGILKCVFGQKIFFDMWKR